MLIITADSHLDHDGVTLKHIQVILDLFKGRDAFFKETLAASQFGLSSLPCGLLGPAVGEPPVEERFVTYRRRGPRTWESRMITVPCSPKTSNLMTVVAGPDDKNNACVLYTIYGGPISPRELGDPSMHESEIELSRQFWSKHALAY